MLNRTIVFATVLASLCIGYEPPARALQAGRGLSASDNKEIYNYTLTMENVQKMSTATQTLMELGKNRPEINNIRNAQSIDEMVKDIQRYPEAVAAIQGSGLPAREYVLCMMNVMQAGMAVAFKKSGTYKNYPPQVREQVSPTNLAFAEQHWDEIQKLTSFAAD
jgi:hypothetical protein